MQKTAFAYKMLIQVEQAEKLMHQFLMSMMSFNLKFTSLDRKPLETTIYMVVRVSLIRILLFTIGE